MPRIKACSSFSSEEKHAKNSRNMHSNPPSGNWAPGRLFWIISTSFLACLPVLSLEDCPRGPEERSQFDQACVIGPALCYAPHDKVCELLAGKSERSDRTRQDYPTRG